jgi:hypothetical protein
LAGLVVASPGLAQEKPKEELVDQVKGAIERGVRRLKQEQRPDGTWERGAPFGGIGGVEGGASCLALLALLTSGVPPTDPVIQNGLRWLRNLPSSGTYVVGLQTMVFAEAGFPQDKPRIQSNVDWLLQGAVPPLVPGQREKLRGWSYGAIRGAPDNSNTQYALLGLYAGKQAGARIHDEVWQHIRDYYRETQNSDGSWGYNPLDKNGRLTMTMAGLCGLYIAGMELHEGQQEFNKVTGIARRCGTYKENDAIAAAHRWIADGQHFTFRPTQYKFYNIYGIERTGRLSGQRFLANRDWYREGCEVLVKSQQEDGSWSEGGGIDNWTNVSTSFAMLFLSKGRTPILITKLAWGGGEEWNRKHYDVKHVVDYASQELFKHVPLAWQVHDGRRLDQSQLLAEVGDLLSSPIVYLNGHETPQLSGFQKEMLKRYIQEGGFVFAEACCGSKAFAEGFRELMKELFDKEMTPLPADHAIYKAHALVPPDKFPLERLDLGCKTVVVLSPRPLAGYWEENLTKDERGLLAFRLAGNIIAYATNMEVPQPRLRRQVVMPEEKGDVRLPRGYLKVAQVRHEGDWQPAPQAMRNLMAHLRQEAKLDLALTTDNVSITSDAVFKYRFFYMHGRKAFDFAEEDLKKLRTNLKTGGLLLADACCGSKEFDASFRTFAQRLFPDGKLEAIPVGDDLYGRDLNGAEIRQVNCRVPAPNGGASEIKSLAPALEGIKVNGRWVVIYSKYDLGCALEKHPSNDCIGHDHESALKLAGAAVLYYLKK